MFKKIFTSQNLGYIGGALSIIGGVATVIGTHAANDNHDEPQIPAAPGAIQPLMPDDDGSDEPVNG